MPSNAPQCPIRHAATMTHQLLVSMVYSVYAGNALIWCGIGARLPDGTGLGRHDARHWRSTGAVFSFSKMSQNQNRIVSTSYVFRYNKGHFVNRPTGRTNAFRNVNRECREIGRKWNAKTECCGDSRKRDTLSYKRVLWTIPTSLRLKNMVIFYAFVNTLVSHFRHTPMKPLSNSA
jgi:hypothetical protein